MRYVSALCYALAIAAHSGALLNTLVLGFLVFAGTVALLFALEGIIRDAVRREPPTITIRARGQMHSRDETSLDYAQRAEREASAQNRRDHVGF